MRNDQEAPLPPARIAAMHAIEVEKHVIGAIMLDSSLAAACARILKPSEMYLEKHQVLWSAICKMAMERAEIDIVTLSYELQKLGLFDLAGGSDYQMEISAEVVSSANVEKHCGIISEHAQRRAFMAGLHDLKMSVDSPGVDMPALISQAEALALRARAAADTSHGVRLVSPDEWIPESLAAYDETIYRGESTGWEGLDQLIRIAPAQTNVWTGIPGHGKSEFLDALMLNLAYGSKWRVAYFSPENNPLRRHTQKLAEKLVGKPLYGTSRMTRKEQADAIHNFMVERFFFFKQGFHGSSFEQILAEAARITPKVNALVIDPWNRIESRRPQGVSETEYILESLRRGARFAESTGISLHIVAHPTKLQTEFKTGKTIPPGLYDISGSAHWYNAIDNGFLVFRNFETGKTEVHNLKTRFKDNGKVGLQEFDYLPSSGRYRQFGPPKFYADAHKETGF